MELYAPNLCMKWYILFDNSIIKSSSFYQKYKARWTLTVRKAWKEEFTPNYHSLSTLILLNTNIFARKKDINNLIKNIKKKKEKKKKKPEQNFEESGEEGGEGGSDRRQGLVRSDLFPRVRATARQKSSKPFRRFTSPRTKYISKAAEERGGCSETSERSKLRRRKTERKRERDESEVGRQIRNRHHIENHNSWDWGLQVRQGRTVTAIWIASQ